MYPKRTVQNGAALILALLLTAVFAAIAGQFFWQLNQWTSQFRYQQDLLKAQSLAEAAIAWSAQLLGEDSRLTRTDHLGEPWALSLPPTPIEEGVLSGRMSDLHARFNINQLADAKAEDIETAKSLLQALELSASTFDTLRLPVAHLSALWPQLPLPLHATLAPHLSALPERVRINPNTATSAVLTAISPSLSHEDRQLFMAGRALKPLDDARITLLGFRNSSAQSRYFEVNVDTTVRQTKVKAMATLVRPDRPVQRATVLWQIME